MRVRCNNDSLAIDLTTEDAFWGRVYVSGWGERCGVHGNGSNSTSLRLALPRREDLAAGGAIDCGLSPAISVDNGNRYVYNSATGVYDITVGRPSVYGLHDMHH